MIKKISIIVLIIINKVLTNNEIKIIITKEGKYSPSGRSVSLLKA